MRAFLIVLLVTTALCEKNYALDSARVHPPFAFYIMPTQLLNPAYSSGFALGTEFSLVRKFSLTLEGGCFYTPGYMGKVNLKYYLAGYIDHHGIAEASHYLGIEYAYKEQSYRVKDRLRDPPETPVNYHVYKYVNAFHFKYGKVVSLPRSVFMDMYVGVGVRYRVVRNTLLPGDEEKMYHMHESFIDNFSNSAAVGFMPSLAFGVKLGYRYR